MKTLVIFLIGGDGDYGALSFQGSGISIKDAYDAIPEGGCSIRAEDLDLEDDWEVEIADQIEGLTDSQVEDIKRAIDIVAGEGGCGDYDGLKHRSYDFLVLEEDV